MKKIFTTLLLVISCSTFSMQFRKRAVEKTMTLSDFEQEMNKYRQQQFTARLAPPSEQTETEKPNNGENLGDAAKFCFYLATLMVAALNHSAQGEK